MKKKYSYLPRALETRHTSSLSSMGAYTEVGIPFADAWVLSTYGTDSRVWGWWTPACLCSHRHLFISLSQHLACCDNDLSSWKPSRITLCLLTERCMSWSPPILSSHNIPIVGLSTILMEFEEWAPWEGCTSTFTDFFLLTNYCARWMVFMHDILESPHNIVQWG